MSAPITMIALLICLALLPASLSQGPEVWACDVRAWTRAPDLFPSTIIPGEARLAANGTACTDIIGWSVGLRFKERAIIKIRNPERPDFPVQPRRPAWNASRHVETDYNNIFSSVNRYFFDRDELSYQDAMDEYNLAIRNESFWIIEGRERIIFDINQELSLENTGEDLDILQAFEIHVPATNFPPILAWNMHGDMGIYGREEQMLNTETLFEYYHNITLTNGTGLSTSAGRAGFIPSSLPISKEDTATQTWPRHATLRSQRSEGDSAENGDPWSHHRRVPRCDKGNLAEFKVEITPRDEVIEQGKNASLIIHMTRTGNGTEYPTFIDMTHALAQNITYAFPFLENSNQTYYDLSRTDDYPRALLSRETLEADPAEMLKVPSMEELKRRRCERSIGSRGWSMSENDGRWPLGKGYIRKDFEDDGQMEQDEWLWEVDLPIGAADVPTFTKTFESLLSVIQISLHTEFLCENAVSTGDATSPEVSTDRDAEWTEYRLPDLPSKRKKFGRRQSMTNTASVPLDMRMPLIASSLPVEHYLSPNALSPFLSLPGSEAKSYAKLDQTLRLETREEQVKARYLGRQRNGRCHGVRGYEGCGRLNGGGGRMHAASVWQGKEAREIEARDEKDSGVKQVKGRKGGKSAVGLVIQS